MAIEPPIRQVNPGIRLIVFSLIATFGCAVDLATKHWIFSWRGPPRPGNIWWLWEGFVGIETAINRGALFGLGKDWTWLFVILSLIAIVGILWWLLLAGALNNRLLTPALGAIIGGILGNLYDRLGLWHAPWIEGGQVFAVRDWILLQAGSLPIPPWPNFNVADSLLVCGAGMLVWHAMTNREGGESG